MQINSVLTSCTKRELRETFDREVKESENQGLNQCKKRKKQKEKKRLATVGGGNKGEEKPS